MIGKLTLLFSVVTGVELALLVQVGQHIGIGATIGLILATALIGGILAKRQGLTIWRRIQEELREGELPRDSLLDGLAVLIAGTLLLTPGVLTDLAGISLLIPFLRAPLRGVVKNRAKDWMDASTITYFESRDPGPDSPFHSGRRTGDGETDPSARTGEPRGAGPATDEEVIDVTPLEEDDEEGDADEAPRTDLSR